MRVTTEIRPIGLLPSIDLRRGEVVRLRQGRDAESTVYAADPLALLAAFRVAGVERAHVVDLDAAFGEPPQRDLLARLAAATERPALELGGGLRSRGAIEAALAAGWERVVVGSLVAREPDRFLALAADLPGRLVPALECDAGTLRLAGWTEGAAASPESLARRLAGAPCPVLLVTDVGRDGTLEGPNLELAAALAAASGLPAIVSGGVASLADLAAARGTPGVGAAIVGRALFEGRFTLAEAMAACRGEAAR
mgnify:CR=1 FL=1